MSASTYTNTCTVPVDSFNGGEQISFAVAMFNMVAVQECGKPAIGRRGDGHWVCEAHNYVVPKTEDK